MWLCNNVVIICVSEQIIMLTLHYYKHLWCILFIVLWYACTSLLGKFHITGFSYTIVMTWKLNKTLLLAVTSAIGSLYQLLIPATSGGGWGRRQAKEKASCKVMVAGEGRVAMQEDVEGKDHLVPPEVGDSTVPPSIHLNLSPVVYKWWGNVCTHTSSYVMLETMTWYPVCDEAEG